MALTSDIFESPKFKQLTPQQQLRIRQDLRDSLVESPKFKLLTAEQRAEILRQYGSFIGPPSTMERIEGALFDALGGIQPGIGQRATAASALMHTPPRAAKSFIRGASMGLIDPEREPALPGDIEERVAPVEWTAGFTGDLLPYIASGMGAGAALTKTPLKALPGLVKRPLGGALTLVPPTAISSRGDPEYMARAGLVGLASGFIPHLAGYKGAALTGATFAALEHLVPKAGEAVGVPLGEAADLKHMGVLAALPMLLHKPPRPVSPPSGYSFFGPSGHLPAAPRTRINLRDPQIEVAPRAVKEPEVAEVRKGPPKPPSPNLSGRRPTFKRGWIVREAGTKWMGNVENEYWNMATGIEHVVVRGLDGAVRTFPAEHLYRPSQYATDYDFTVDENVPPTRRVAAYQTVDNIKKSRSALELDEIARTPGELRGLFSVEANLKEAIAMGEEIRGGYRPPVMDFDATDLGMLRMRNDLSRVKQRINTVIKFAGKSEHGLSKEQVKEILEEQVLPSYDVVRGVDGELMGDVQSAQRHLEGTVKEPGAPLESASMAMRKGPLKNKYTEDKDFVVFEDLEHTTPLRLTIDKLNRPLNQIVLQPEAVIMNPEIQIAMQQALEGKFTASVQRRLNFRVDWPSEAHIGFFLERMGFPKKQDQVRLRSIMDRLVPGWNTQSGFDPPELVPAQPSPNPAAEKIRGVAAKPPGTVPLISPETGDIGRIESRPTPETVDIIAKAIELPKAAEIPAKEYPRGPGQEISPRYHALQPGPLGAGIYALNVRKINLMEARITDLLRQAGEQYVRLRAGDTTARTRINEIKHTIGELRGRVHMLHNANRRYYHKVYEPPTEVEDTSVRPFGERDPKVMAQIREASDKAHRAMQEASKVHDEILSLEEMDARGVAPETKLIEGEGIESIGRVGPAGRRESKRLDLVERLQEKRAQYESLKKEQQFQRMEVNRIKEENPLIDWLPSNKAEFDVWLRNASNEEFFSAFDHMTNEPFLYPKSPERGVAKPPEAVEKPPPIMDSADFADVFEAHLRDLPTRDLLNYMSDPALTPEMRSMAKDIYAEIKSDTEFVKTETKELENIEPRTKFVRQTAEAVPVSDEVRQKLSRQLGAAGPQTLIKGSKHKKRLLKVGTGFEIKEILDPEAQDLKTVPPEDLFILNDRGPEPGLRSFAHSLGTDIEVVPGGYNVEGVELRSLKEVNAILRQYAKAKRGESTVGAKEAEPPDILGPQTRRSFLKKVAAVPMAAAAARHPAAKKVLPAAEEPIGFTPTMPQVVLTTLRDGTRVSTIHIPREHGGPFYETAVIAEKGPIREWIGQEDVDVVRRFKTLEGAKRGHSIIQNFLDHHFIAAATKSPIPPSDYPSLGHIEGPPPTLEGRRTPAQAPAQAKVAAGVEAERIGERTAKVAERMLGPEGEAPKETPRVRKQPPQKPRPMKPPRDVRDTRTPPGATVHPRTGRVLPSMLTPRMINAAAFDSKAAITQRVDGGWMLKHFPTQRQLFFPEDPTLPDNGWRAVLEALDALPVVRPPDLGPGGVGGAGPPRMPVTHGPSAGGEPYAAFYANAGSVAFKAYARPTHALTAEMEQKTPFKVWTKVYKPMDTGAAQADHFVRPWRQRVKKIMRPVWWNQIEAVDDYITTKAKWRGTTAARWQMKPKVRAAADKLITAWKDLLMNHMGMTEAGVENLLTHYMPRMRRANGNLDTAFTKYNLPEELSPWANYVRRGEIELHGTNPVNNLLAMARIVANQKFIEPVWAEARAVIDAKIPGTTQFAMPKTMRDVMLSYTDTVRRMPHESMQVVNQAVTEIMHKFKLDKIITPNVRGNVVNMLMSAHYGGTMWYRPALAIRNLLQSTLVIPEVGLQAWAHGIARAATPNGARQAMEHLYLRPLVEGQAQPFEMAGYDLPGGFWKAWQDSGMFLYRGADITNRAISYHAGRWAIEAYGKQYAAGKLTRQQFLNKTGLNRQYTPIKQDVLQHFDNRQMVNLEAAMRAYGENVVRNTQWTYRRGNEPASFRGVWGRAFGQYGIWPVNLADMMVRNFAGKTGASAVHRLAWAGRLASVWTVTELILEKLFGINANRMTWINPLSWFGGPLFQGVMDMRAAMGGSEFEKRIARARLKRLVTSFIPGHHAYRDIRDAIEELERTEDFNAFLTLLIGFDPAEADEQNFLLEDVPDWGIGQVEDLERMIGADF